jgi:hypothetical protein
MVSEACRTRESDAAARVLPLFAPSLPSFSRAVHPEIELVPNAGSDRSWTWRTVDYSTDEAEKQTFALRFKDAETAGAFKNKYDECRTMNAENDKEKGTGTTSAAAASPEKPSA